MEFKSSANFTITADQPIAVGQFFEGENATTSSTDTPAEGDPSFVLLPPIEQWRSSYTVLAAPGIRDNYLGVAIDEKLALGTVLVRLITPRHPADLLGALKAASYGVTCQDAHGANGPVRVVLTVVQRKELPQVLGLIQRHEPTGFYAVEELQTAARGVFPLRSRGVLTGVFRAARPAEVLAAK